MFKVKIIYLLTSPQYHSASSSVYVGGEGPLLFMVEDTGLVDLGGRATSRRERGSLRKGNAKDLSEIA